MMGNYYRLVGRDRGWKRYGARNDRTDRIYWFYTRWGAVRWIAMNSADQIKEL